jgi:hypothetical protein
MRTTLTIDPDVGKEIERRRRERGTTLKQEINELLRIGLRDAQQATARRSTRYRTPPASVGRLLVGSLDDVAEALEAAEGADFR